MPKRGRPRSTWQMLKARNAKPSVWKKRQAEEELAAAIPKAAREYLAHANETDSTFASRIIDGQAVCRTLSGERFDWPSNHYATICRTFAKDVSSGKRVATKFNKKLCSRFLNDLTIATGWVFDPEGAKSLEKMMAAFSVPGAEAFFPEFLLRVEWMCWKSRTDGNVYRFPDELMLSFHEESIEVFDKACLAQQATAK